MNLSSFGQKFTSKSGILELMEDLEQGASGKENLCMLGGGNPAHLEAVTRRIRDRMETLLANGNDFEKMLVYYDTPKGSALFCSSVAELLQENYGWQLSEKNVAVVNSSQLAFFYLLNMFS